MTSDLRCFVALRPDPACAAALEALARSLARRNVPARVVDRGNLHLTLAFIGALDAARAPAIVAALATLPALSGAWNLDRVGAFTAARVIWAAGAPQPQLFELAARVRHALHAQGVAFDRRAFVPHVTLLRGPSAALDEALPVPIAWRLGPAELLVSARDAGHRLRYRPWSATPPA